jgi:5-methylcytosine-specific restriction endonuclease McrA
MPVPRVLGCKYCSQTGHFEFACHKKPRKPLIAKKRLNKTGKHFTKWRDTRNRWLQVNKAPYYFCYLCNKMMTKSQLTLDHVKSRSRYPELRYELSNLRPCCWIYNEKKGSRDINEL